MRAIPNISARILGPDRVPLAAKPTTEPNDESKKAQLYTHLGIIGIKNVAFNELMLSSRIVYHRL